MKMDKKKFTIYMIFAFGLAWVIQIIASIFSRNGNVAVFQLLLSVCMFMPFLATLIARIPLKGMGWIPKLKGNIGWILLAWFGPMVLTILGAAIFYIIFPNRLDWSGSYMAIQMGEEAMAELQATGITVPILTIITVVQACSYVPLVNGLAGLGEEVGWRGVMYPMLKDKLGRVKGMILSGVIWGAWHWPSMVLAGYEYGLEYWGAPFLGMAMFCLYTTVGGIILDVLYERTKCIWVPSVGHGAINATAGVPMLMLNAEFADQLTIGPLPIGIISMIPYIIVAILLLVLTGKKKEN
jgi:membrane protease YdiL (CAAX protease family)